METQNTLHRALGGFLCGHRGIVVSVGKHKAESTFVSIREAKVSEYTKLKKRVAGDPKPLRVEFSDFTLFIESNLPYTFGAGSFTIQAKDYEVCFEYTNAQRTTK
jgi:hypothetical protein